MELPKNIQPFEIVNQRLITTVRRFEVIKDDIECDIYSSETKVGDILEEVFDKPNYFINVSSIKRDILNDENCINYNIHDIYYLDINLYSINEDIDSCNEPDGEPEYSEYWELGHFLEHFKEIEPVNIKESEIFLMYGKSLARKYKSKIKQLAKLNEDLTIMREMFEIKDL